MGTPDFSVPPLEALVAAGHDVALVVTQPDRPRGRGLGLEASPVKKAALRLGLPVFQPEKPNRDDAVGRIAAAGPEALVVVAYGAILKSQLLAMAPFGAINLHASLLPKYRGMSPIQRAIWDGETTTGITTMHMDQGVDTGDMILSVSVPIGPDETGGALHDRLSEAGARLLVETLARLAAGTAPRIPQTGEASYAPRLEKEHGTIDWSLDAATVHNRARALTPWPGATAFIGGVPIGVRKTRVGEVAAGAAEAGGGQRMDPVADQGSGAVAAPGTVIAVAGDALRVACGSGVIDLLEVRPAGKSTMSGADFARGKRLRMGVDRFDAPGTSAAAGSSAASDSPAPPGTSSPPNTSGDPR
jgi:methionyl-tRNA formyltransferase